MHGFILAVAIVAVVIWALSPTNFVRNLRIAILLAASAVTAFAVFVAVSIYWPTQPRIDPTDGKVDDWILPESAKKKTAGALTFDDIAPPLPAGARVVRWGDGKKAEPESFELLVQCDYSSVLLGQDACPRSAAIACDGRPGWKIIGLGAYRTDGWPGHARVLCSNR